MWNNQFCISPMGMDSDFNLSFQFQRWIDIIPLYRKHRSLEGSFIHLLRQKRIRNEIRRAKGRGTRGKVMGMAKSLST